MGYGLLGRGYAVFGGSVGPLLRLEIRPEGPRANQMLARFLLPR
jgi:hypothetical protein